MIRGRRITPADLQNVQELLSEKPELGRWGLALELCQRWQWRTKQGDWKGRAAAAVLTGLAQRGWIQLPASSRSRTPGPARGPKAESWSSEAIGGPLNRYRPLRWELVRTAPQRQHWRQLLDAYHYLGAPGMVGANLKYFIYGPAGQLLGALGWQSAVGHLGCRNRLLAWNPEQRARSLDRLVSNVRFLLLPWVKVPGLASVILSEGLRRLERDWPQHYGQSVWWVESFVDPQRFEACSYRAAGWRAIGWTQGFAKRPEGFVHHGQKKEVYVYVLEARMRRLIHGDDRQPLLTRALLLAQRRSEEEQLAKKARMKRILASWKPTLPSSGQLSAAQRQGVGQELSSFVALFHEAFGRVEPRQWLELYLQELLNRVPGQNWPPIRRRLADPDQVRNAERFLSDYRWDESWMAERHWQLAAQTLSDPQGLWSIDLRPFSKAGPTWVGAASQEGGAFGRRGHCQWGIFIGYSSPKGQGLLESRLYLPPCWFKPEFTERRRHCRIPQETTFQTEQHLALEMLGRLWNSQLFGGHWIGCDSTLASQEGFLEQLPKDAYYLAEIACTRQFWVQQTGLPTAAYTVEQLLHAQLRLQCQTQPLLEKGPDWVAYARRRVYLSAPPNAQGERWLLLRRRATGQIQCALSNAPADIPMSELVRVSTARWSLARSLDPGKSELGLDQYEHRSWTAWHRHMRLVSLAQLFRLRVQLKGQVHSSAQLVASGPAPPPPLRARTEAASPPAQ